VANAKIISHLPTFHNVHAYLFKMLTTIIFVLALHLIADFLLQPNWIQTYKSRDNLVLLTHVVIYMMVMTLGLMFIASWQAALAYAFINSALHFLVDYCSSRLICSQAKEITIDVNEPVSADKPLYEQVDLYIPSLLLGIDQLAHQACLILTLHILF